MQQQQEKHELELHAARQEEVSLQASLMALKTQVDPHFLFTPLKKTNCGSPLTG